MAINFPDTPALGQEFTDPTSGNVWTWDGITWNGAGGSGGGGAAGPQGPPGPTAVSADAGNVSKLGSDSLLYTPATDVTGFVKKTGDTMTGNLTVPTLNGMNVGLLIGATNSAMQFRSKEGKLIRIIYDNVTTDVNGRSTIFYTDSYWISPPSLQLSIVGGGDDSFLITIRAFSNTTGGAEIKSTVWDGNPANYWAPGSGLKINFLAIGEVSS